MLVPSWQFGASPRMVVTYRATASADFVSSNAIGSTTLREGMTRSSSMATSAWMDSSRSTVFSGERTLLSNPTISER